jgi:hypothetical protein
VGRVQSDHAAEAAASRAAEEGADIESDAADHSSKDDHGPTRQDASADQCMAT